MINITSNLGALNTLLSRPIFCLASSNRLSTNLIGSSSFQSSTVSSCEPYDQWITFSIFSQNIPFPLSTLSSLASQRLKSASMVSRSSNHAVHTAVFEQRLNQHTEKRAPKKNLSHYHPDALGFLSEWLGVVNDSKPDREGLRAGSSGDSSYSGVATLATTTNYREVNHTKRAVFGEHGFVSEAAALLRSHQANDLLDSVFHSRLKFGGARFA